MLRMKRGTMEERRKEERKTLVAYTQVYDLYGGAALIGYLGDLTVKGAMIISEKTIAKDVEMTLAIELPELPSIKASRITLPARVAWCEKDISPEFYNVGFEFKEVKPEQKDIIESIIKNYEFRRDAPPTFPTR